MTMPYRSAARAARSIARQVPRWFLGAVVAGALAGAAVMPSSAAADDLPAARNVLYITSNSYIPGTNTVLAYRRNPVDGSLALFGAVLTGGTGVRNVSEGLGPDDSDQELIVTPGHRWLFAVNSGSNTVAVFHILPNGNLIPAKGSPYFSGGIEPVSLGLASNRLYVVNKGSLAPGQFDGGLPPSYTGFHINTNGSLAPIPNSTIYLAPGSDPTQALIAPNGNYLFGIQLFRFPFPPPPNLPPFIPPLASAIDSYRILDNGRLAPAPGTPQMAPTSVGAPYLLGLQAHPKLPIVYAGLVAANGIATYEHNHAGALTFLGSSPNSGLAICWITINRQGTFMYTSDSGTDSISVYSLANPRQPIEIQNLALKGPKAPIPQPAPTLFNTTPFQLTLDPSGRFLYVLNHEVTTADNFPQGNALHILQVNPNGTIGETSQSPVILPEFFVPKGAHPKGIVAL